jgi:hypothetical protein
MSIVKLRHMPFESPPEGDMHEISPYNPHPPMHGSGLNVEPGLLKLSRRTMSAP